MRSAAYTASWLSASAIFWIKKTEDAGRMMNDVTTFTLKDTRHLSETNMTMRHLVLEFGQRCLETRSSQDNRRTTREGYSILSDLATPTIYVAASVAYGGNRDRERGT